MPEEKCKKNADHKSYEAKGRFENVLNDLFEANPCTDRRVDLQIIKSIVNWYGRPRTSLQPLKTLPACNPQRDEEATNTEKKALPKRNLAIVDRAAEALPIDRKQVGNVACQCC
jgi:hypothetical protein